MQIAVRHRISVQIGEGAPRAIQHLLLTPKNSRMQIVKSWHVEAPGMDESEGFIDACGNRAHLSSQTKPEPEIAIEAAGIVETRSQDGVVGRLDGDPVPAVFKRVTPLTRPLGAVTSRFRSAPRQGGDRIALLHALMARVGEVLGEQVPTQSQGGTGQSQHRVPAAAASAAEHAHAFIGAARALDIPARYITGYLAAESGRSGSFHAWAEAWDDALGWIAFDPLLNHCPADRHVRLASGLDAQTTLPVRSVPMTGTAVPLIAEVRAE